MGEYWSWVLTSAGLVGLWLAGSKRRVGWVLGISVQPVWITFAVVTEQYGFVVSGAAYGLVYGRNWWRWRQEQAAQRACPYGDETCPCQDGDPCHYKDDPVTGTPAMTPPAGGFNTPPDACTCNGSGVLCRGDHQPGGWVNEVCVPQVDAEQLARSVTRRGVSRG